MIVTETMKRLKTVEENCARRIAGVHGYLTAGEANLLWELRLKTGMKYDAHMCRFEELDEYEKS